MFIETNLNKEQRAALERLFRQNFVQPDEVAQQLKLRRLEAITLLDKLTAENPQRFVRKYLIFHGCSEAPVGTVSDGKTIKQGWICPECEEEVDLEELDFELMYRAIALVNFTKPNDGLVRYWRVDYFPFYVKGFSPNVEPAIILPQDKAQEFDGLVEAARQGQDHAFKEIANQYRDVVEAIVREVV